MPAHRVVITGLGLISPLGNSKEALWDALVAGRSGVAVLDGPDGPILPVRFAAEARQFTGDIEDFGPLEKEQKKSIRKGLKLMCRESQMGVAAAQLALNDIRGWRLAGSIPSRRAACLGPTTCSPGPRIFPRRSTIAATSRASSTILAGAPRG